MIYVGIDIAKLNHYAAVLSSDGVVLTEPFKFTNDGDGFQMLSSELSDYAPESMIIGLESTAHYGDIGLDPSVKQSGNFNASHTRMSKRGSKVFRYALMSAAHNVVKNNVTFNAYYNKKMAEGRTHYNALGHCAGKLVRVIWKMVTDDINFNLD